MTGPQRWECHFTREIFGPALHRTYHGGRLGETISRLRSLFGSGWFFEWPGGKRPLNSTWPWADIKPSLLVLWGVCWMFVVAPTIEIPRNSAYHTNRPYNQRSVSYRPEHFFLASSDAQPVVKREPPSHAHTPIGGDWPLYQAGASPVEAYTTQTQTHPHIHPHTYYSPQAQPMSALAHDPDPRRFHLDHQASPTAPLAMRTPGPGSRATTALSPAQGCLQNVSDTNTNANNAQRSTASARRHGTSGLRRDIRPPDPGISKLPPTTPHGLLRRSSPQQITAKYISHYLVSFVFIKLPELQLPNRARQQHHVAFLRDSTVHDLSAIIHDAGPARTRRQ
ncbi:hypothetical protein G7Y89_g10878 [Cudoniella acicularis]|uniref:Uncharacterized protein n=1 Tax=Cudoniella acicularis TaxID=354080 RepID=A0A8H4REQ5_9HELO|nr:hypothetical protein G7Y89_g10878 [Cudoniella acicularis]